MAYLFFLVANSQCNGSQPKRRKSALNSVKGDGLSLPPDDTQYLEVLIDEYFDESESEYDDECGSESGYGVRLLFAFFLYLSG